MKLATLKPDIKLYRDHYRSSIDLERHAEATATTFHASLCVEMNMLLDYIEKLENQLQQKQRTIDRLVSTCEDYGVTCAECGGELSKSEVEDGYCLDCARLLS